MIENDIQQTTSWRKSQEKIRDEIKSSGKNSILN